MKIESSLIFEGWKKLVKKWKTTIIWTKLWCHYRYYITTCPGCLPFQSVESTPGCLPRYGHSLFIPWNWLPRCLACSGRLPRRLWYRNSFMQNKARCFSWWTLDKTLFIEQFVLFWLPHLHKWPLLNLQNTHYGNIVIALLCNGSTCFHNITHMQYAGQCKG